MASFICQRFAVIVSGWLWKLSSNSGPAPVVLSIMGRLSITCRGWGESVSIPLIVPSSCVVNQLARPWGGVISCRVPVCQYCICIDGMVVMDVVVVLAWRLEGSSGCVLDGVSDGWAWASSYCPVEGLVKGASISAWPSPEQAAKKHMARNEAIVRINFFMEIAPCFGV